MGLSRYHAKRNFAVTSEPKGDSGPSGSSQLLFVVQKHQARRLHYDFRLEIDGVLKSWAVPKGPSLDPSVRRLAVEVEDHPLSYANFEGLIPEGQYGAGQVIVWDTGRWQAEGSPAAGLQAGKLTFSLYGQRLTGRWRLLRTAPQHPQPQWLLSKLDDEAADPQSDIVKRFTTSVLNGQAIGHRSEVSLPEFIAPKLPSLTAAPPKGKPWIHEWKIDGYRMLARWSVAGELTLRTRSGADWTGRYPSLAAALSGLPLRGTILDGELAAIDQQGRADFSGLQSAADTSTTTLVFFAFDLLFLHGEDLRKLPLNQRKQRLQQLLTQPDVARVTRLQYLDHIVGDPGPLVAQCRRLELEGIVSKRIDRGYASGRAQDWVKTKHRYREPLVIGGYEISSDDQTLSSLLLGYFDNDHGQLLFAGRVGSGWSASAAEKLLAQLKPFRADDSPFAKRLTGKRGKDSSGRTQWLKPAAVAAIEFAGWTRSGSLRHATFVALEPTTAAEQVTRQLVFAESPQSDAEDSASSAPPLAPVSTPPRPLPATPLAKLPATSELTSPDKVLFPEEGITKAEMAAYLFQVNQWMLPHLVNRPLSLVRCPDGISATTYFQRHPQKGMPAEIRHLTSEGDSKPLLVLRNVAGLLATAQIAAIELHPWGCRADRLERPDRMILDLDPDPALPWERVVAAGLQIRELLKQRQLISFVKTTGGKGLHVVVPLSRRTTWEQLFHYSQRMAEELAASAPTQFTANMSKAKRRQRIYVDYHRNRRGSTAIAAYSLRARPAAPVSTPVTWQELPGVVPLDFTIRSLPQRLAQLSSDPWEGISTIRQSLG